MVFALVRNDARDFFIVDAQLLEELVIGRKTKVYADLTDKTRSYEGLVVDIGFREEMQGKEMEMRALTDEQLAERLKNPRRRRTVNT